MKCCGVAQPQGRRVLGNLYGPAVNKGEIMSNAEEILSKHVDKDSMDELSENVFPDMINAMKEYAITVIIPAIEYENKPGNDDSSAKDMCGRILKNVQQNMEEPEEKCPSCGMAWYRDCDQFGCWSCGHITQREG